MTTKLSDAAVRERLALHYELIAMFASDFEEACAALPPKADKGTTPPTPCVGCGKRLYGSCGPCATCLGLVQAGLNGHGPEEAKR